MKGLAYGAVRDAAVGQYALLGQVVGRLDDHELVLPTLLGDWTVAELVAHLARCVEAVSAFLNEPAPERAEMDTTGYLTATAFAADAIAQRARDDVDHATADQLRERLRRSGVEAALALQRLGDQGARRIVQSRLGAIPLTDFLATRCVEGVVHGLDLATAVEHDTSTVVSEPALAVAVRALADVLATRHPGRSVEVRVPGQLAVQCLEGPPHKRGTPGNVIESDALTFVCLATGRTTWREAVDSGAVHASGSRADLEPYLPLMS